jgi:hypothetical protein
MRCLRNIKFQLRMEMHFFQFSGYNDSKRDIALENVTHVH